jgi:hypothetical protein
MARQILAQGELYLGSQQTLAIAADQRATTAASILASAATAIAAAFIAFWDKDADKSALIGGIAAAALLMVAAIMAAYAARPTDFDSPGNHPVNWFDNRKENIVTMIGGEAESVQRRIERNAAIMAANQRCVTRAFIVAVSSPAVGLLIWVAVSNLSC